MNKWIGGLCVPVALLCSLLIGCAGGGSSGSGLTSAPPPV